MTNDLLAALRTFFARSDLSPGCYNEPDFLKIEESAPNAIEAYALHVLTRERSADKDARTIRIVDELIRRLVEGTSPETRGMCVNTSLCIVQMLEDLGVWAFAVAGAMEMRFDASTKVHPSTRHFWMDEPPAHAWVVAPPFIIVDCTLRAQHWVAGEERHLPDRITVTRAAPASYRPDLYWSPRGRQPPSPGHTALWKWLPIQAVRVGSVEVTYCPGGIKLPSEPLSTKAQLDVGGMRVSEWFRRVRTEIAATV